MVGHGRPQRVAHLVGLAATLHTARVAAVFSTSSAVAWVLAWLASRSAHGPGHVVAYLCSVQKLQACGLGVPLGGGQQAVAQLAQVIRPAEHRPR
jgi:hypothetical protein